MRQEGFVRYVLSNPESFFDVEDLLQKLGALVRSRGWSPRFSRNLIVSNLHLSQPDPHVYGDHTGTFKMRTWAVDIENRRPDVAATRTICILDKIIDAVGSQPSLDRSFLKWSGFHQRYENTLLPEDFGTVNLLAVREQERGLFLPSQKDFSPREPILRSDGPYLLQFKVFSEGFPLLKFDSFPATAGGVARLLVGWLPRRIGRLKRQPVFATSSATVVKTVFAPVLLPLRSRWSKPPKTGHPGVARQRRRKR